MNPMATKLLMMVLQTIKTEPNAATVAVTAIQGLTHILHSTGSRSILKSMLSA